MFDLVIRNGLLVDGTGCAPRTADVAVERGQIVEVGTVGQSGREEIEARGLLVTPGWVDVHTHYDAQVTWDAHLTPSAWHGVTSVVMGSCGVGFAPARPDRHDWLIDLMEGVEDIPGAAMHEGLTWGWEHFPEYLDRIDLPRAVDFAAQVPHGAVRGYVMGERGARNEPATADDIARMAAIVEDGVRAGAVGFSTSRTLLHKAASGELVPGTFADRDELWGLGRALQRAGGGVFQMAGEHTDMLRELEWMTALSADIGRPVSFNLQQVDHAPELWREVLGALEQAAARGSRVRAQIAGRPQGVLMNWAATANPFVACPAFNEVKFWSSGVEDLRARLRDPAVRARVVADTPIPLGPFEDFVTRAFHKMYPMAAEPVYEPRPDESVAAIAARSGVSPAAVAYDALMEADGTGFLYLPLFNYTHGDFRVIEALLDSPWTVLGLGDGGAHCGAICDASIPTFMLSHWVRDRTRGRRWPLEAMVRRLARDPARLFALNDRGVVAPGYRADLNVIDFDRLGLDRPQVTYDLPAGGRRLTQRARGYVATVVAGEVTWRDGQPTGALPGRLVRGARAAPQA